MYEEKELFWVSLLYYAISIFSIYVVIVLYLEGDQLAYFISFVCLFGIDKIITLLLIEDKSKILFWVCDVFQIGFVYIFFVEKFFKNIHQSIEAKINARVFPQIILEFIFFFCLGTLQDNKISGYTLYAALSNYILFVLLLIILFIILIREQELEQNKKKYLIIFLDLATYYMTVGTLIQNKDIFGINLGYYQLLLIVIDQLVFFLMQIRNSWEENILFAIYNIFLNSSKQLFNNDYDDNNKSYCIIQYLNQIFRVCVLISFSYEDLSELFEVQVSASSKIKQICIFISLSLSLLYFLFYFNDFQHYFIRLKVIQIKNERHLRKAIQILNRKFTLITQYDIIFQNYLYITDQQNLIQQCERSNEQDLRILFILTLSQQYEVNKKIILRFEGQYPFSELSDLIIREVEIINKVFLSNIEEQHINFQNIMQRIENGFINQTTNTIIWMMYNPNNEINSIQSVISNVMSLNAFLKQLSGYMMVNPSVVLYDLYESD